MFVLQVGRRVLGVEKQWSGKMEEILLRHGTEMSFLEFEQRVNDRRPLIDT